MNRVITGSRTKNEVGKLRKKHLILLLSFMLVWLYATLDLTRKCSLAVSDNGVSSVTLTIPNFADFNVTSKETLDENLLSIDKTSSHTAGEYIFATTIDLTVTGNKNWEVSVKGTAWETSSGHPNKDIGDLQITCTNGTENVSLDPTVSEGNYRHVTAEEFTIIKGGQGSPGASGMITCDFKMHLNSETQASDNYTNTVTYTVSTIG